MKNFKKDSKIKKCILFLLGFFVLFFSWDKYNFFNNFSVILEWYHGFKFEKLFDYVKEWQTLISVSIASILIPYYSYRFKKGQLYKKNNLIVYKNIVYDLNQFLDIRRGLLDFEDNINIIVKKTQKSIGKASFNPEHTNVPFEDIKKLGEHINSLEIKDLVILNKGLNIVRLIDILNKNINSLVENLNFIIKKEDDVLKNIRDKINNKIDVQIEETDSCKKEYILELEKIMKNTAITYSSTGVILEQLSELKVYIEFLFPDKNKSKIKNEYDYNNIGEKNKEKSVQFIQEIKMSEQRARLEKNDKKR
ncbi:MAG: hypothetical protein KAI16_00240 [Candidatus Pacebacteria bacterium]|nr:hypothetical protein [Candidatus Paceibacterota bacterium]